MSRSEIIPVNARVGKILEVPDEKLGPDDAWVREAREEFELFANEERGLRQVDLIRRKRPPGSTVPLAAPVKRFTPVSRFLVRYFSCNSDLARLSFSNDAKEK